jgi:soluble lytic murein transglycosylase
MSRKKTKLGGGTTIGIGGLFTALATSLLAGLLAFPSNASAQEIRTSTLTPDSEQIREVDLPHLLSETDANLYRRILTLQAAGKFTEADRDIAALTDKLLLGTVQAQRYLSPKYRSSYAELRDWLAAYADAPEARSIYSMAMKRHSAGQPAPAAPLSAAGLRAYENTSMAERPARGDGGPDRHRAKPAGDVDNDRSLAETRDDRDVSMSHWSEGLAAWRDGKIDQALAHFQTLAKSNNQSAWVLSASAFWTARAELRSRKPELFNYWMGRAAEHPRTFYGLLARRTLGIDSYFDFEIEGFTELDAQILTGIPAGRRALGLLQIGETQRAEIELRALASRASRNVLQSLVSLADRVNMPGLSLQLAGHIADGGPHHDRALYPIPHWTPLGGFAVDRALLFGLMRQESEFRPIAHNASGAMGLMQLMPATARSMASRTGLRARNLADPEVNLALAQEYVIDLINDPHVHGNLLFLTAAYNTGPAAVPRLAAAAGGSKDPLMFVESIGNRETHAFVQRVLTNYWIYRLRLGQPTPDLDTLAAGEWPTYTALDQRAEPMTRHAEN